MILRSLFDSLKRENAPMPISQAYRDTWLYKVFTGEFGDFASGVSVNERSAMSNPAVWTCVDLKATAIASVPWKVYERQNPRGRRTARELREYRILHDAPSTEDTSFTFRHKMVGNLLLWGNAYAEKIYDGANRLAALYHHPACTVRVELGTRRGDYRYVVITADGERPVAREDMVHLRGFAFDGIVGLSVIQNLRRSIGVNISAEVFAQNFYNNGARASGVLMYPGKLGDKARANLTESFDEKHAGLKNAHKTILLEENVKYQQLTVPPNDAQFLETRQYGRAEIAGIFAVPVMLVPGATADTPTYASSESFMRFFVDFSLRGTITNIENEFNVKLFPNDGVYYSEFDLRGLLRGNSTERAQLHKAMWEVGSKNANDINDDEGENPVPGGDRYYIPANNFVPVDRVDDVIDAQIKPKSEPNPTQTQPQSGGSKTEIRPSYKRMFSEFIADKDRWSSFREETAVKKFTPLFRGIADDLIGEGNGKEFVEEYIGSFAKRAKSLTGDSIDAELKRAIAEISAHGGSHAGS
jgi:HK97 family phage portal protein